MHPGVPLLGSVAFRGTNSFHWTNKDREFHGIGIFFGEGYAHHAMFYCPAGPDPNAPGFGWAHSHVTNEDTLALMASPAPVIWEEAAELFADNDRWHYQASLRAGYTFNVNGGPVDPDLEVSPALYRRLALMPSKAHLALPTGMFSRNGDALSHVRGENAEVPLVGADGAVKTSQIVPSDLDHRSDLNRRWVHFLSNLQRIDQHPAQFDPTLDMGDY